MSATGDAVGKLADAVRSDLEAVAADMEALRLKVESLGEAARAINGLGGCCTGWSSHLRTLIEEVQKEQREVPAKLTGSPIHALTEYVNQELAEKVKADPRRKAS